MGLQLFFISRLFMVRFSNGFQLNDGNTLLNTVLVSDKSQIFFFFHHVENHCLSPGGVYSDTLSGGKGSHRETITKPGRIRKPLQPKFCCSSPI